MEFTFREAQIIVDALNKATIFTFGAKNISEQQERQKLIYRFERQIIGKVKKVKK